MHVETLEPKWLLRIRQHLNGPRVRQHKCLRGTPALTEYGDITKRRFSTIFFKIILRQIAVFIQERGPSVRPSSTTISGELYHDKFNG